MSHIARASVGLQAACWHFGRGIITHLLGHCHHTCLATVTTPACLTCLLYLRATLCHAHRDKNKPDKPEQQAREPKAPKQQQAPQQAHSNSAAAPEVCARSVCYRMPCFNAQASICGCSVLLQVCHGTLLLLLCYVCCMMSLACLSACRVARLCGQQTVGSRPTSLEAH